MRKLALISALLAISVLSAFPAPADLDNSVFLVFDRIGASVAPERDEVIDYSFGTGLYVRSEWENHIGLIIGARSVFGGPNDSLVSMDIGLDYRNKVYASLIFSHFAVYSFYPSDENSYGSMFYNPVINSRIGYEFSLFNSEIMCITGISVDYLPDDLNNLIRVGAFTSILLP